MTQTQNLQQELQERRQAFRKVRAQLRIAADALENVSFKAAQALSQLQELSRSLVQLAEKIQETRRKLNQAKATNARVVARSTSTSKKRTVPVEKFPTIRSFPPRRGN